MFGVTRKTYDKRMPTMTDKDYWDEADRASRSCQQTFGLKQDRLQLQDVRTKAEKLKNGG